MPKKDDCLGTAFSQGGCWRGWKKKQRAEHCNWTLPTRVAPLVLARSFHCREVDPPMQGLTEGRAIGTN